MGEPLMGFGEEILEQREVMCEPTAESVYTLFRTLFLHSYLVIHSMVL